MKLEIPDSQEENLVININADAPQQSTTAPTTTKPTTGITQLLLIGIIILALNPNLAASLLAGLQLPNPGTNSTSNPTTPLASNQPKDYDRFLRTLENLILPIEGKCSDHPNDRGGRTFMGITYKTAQRWGWTKDVCKMPVEKVHEIYYQDYWVKSGAIDQDSEAVAAVLFDIGVNSGPGKAKQFLDQAPNRLKGKELALWITAKQRQNYAAIIARDPTQKVFKRGWNNRNDKVRNYIKTLQN